MKYLLYILIAVLPLQLKAQIITNFAGYLYEGYTGDGGPAINARLNYPYNVCASRSGNVYIADYSNNVIRKVDTAGIITTVAGIHTSGYTGDGGLATAARISYPWDVAVDTFENIYIADYGNQVIRKVDAVTGIITTVAGNHTYSFSGDGGLATAAALYDPEAVAVDYAGNIYIADAENHRIRMVNAAGIISTIAGTGIAGYSGDDSLAVNAKISQPSGIKADEAGNVYFSDYSSHVVRKIDATGIITTVAGTGISGFSGDGGAATLADLDGPNGVALDKFGNLYVCDFPDNTLRKISTSGIITTIAGISGYEGYSGVGFPAVYSELGAPVGVAVDTSGNIYIADCFNHMIQKIIEGCLPSVITGMDSVCIGAAIQLSDSVAGGTWSASNGSATVSTTGMIAGVTTGIDTITYSVTNVCGTNSASRVIHVQTTASALAGNDSVCAGATIALSDSVSGGSWSVANADAAISTAGIVEGLLGGEDTVIYTLQNSCGTTIVDKPFFVKPLPSVSSIMGTFLVCAADSVLFTDTTAGGVWSSALGHAVVTSGGIVSGISPGYDTIFYTVTNTCGSNTVSYPMVISVPPLLTPVTGYDSVCIGDSILLSDSLSPGGVWGLTNAAASIHNGMVTGLYAGIDTVTYTVYNTCGATTIFDTVYIRSADMCISLVPVELVSDQYEIYPDPSKGIFTVRGGDNFPGDMTITISNVLGTTIETRFIKGAANIAEPFDISDRPKGLYFVRLVKKDKIYTVKEMLN